ncbi:uncharacterized protein LOC117646580 [Thrips palmi]|uniref:Uncharacterized protein LOC117646580 n=1 Tax=Thrips palmi TaxID=161013 RepID=A0A6P8Z939_THRPL|nr:uncharacterized protein LOC117646580 [Thrips palmi]
MRTSPFWTSSTRSRKGKSSPRRDSKVSALKVWCRGCDRAAVEDCLDLGHVLCSLRKVRSEQVQPRLQQLGHADSDTDKMVESLEHAKDAVEGLLQFWRDMQRQVKQARRELLAAVDEGGDLEAGQPEGLQQLQDAASLLEGMECGLRHQGGTEWRGDLGASRSLLNALVLHLHRHGRIHKDAFQPQPAVAAPPPAADRIQELKLGSLSWTAAGSEQQEKAATLARVRQHGVRRMTSVGCHRDPAWALDVLRSAAPTLEELSVWYPRQEHLLAAHAMPALRRMDVYCGDGALDAQPPSLPALPRSALKWLRVAGLPRPALASLLRAHSASLEELWLHVGTPGGGQWPRGCDDLDALLGQCGLRVSRVVLWRGYVTHSPSACTAQVSAVRRVLPAATVQCYECEEVAWEAF